MLVVIMDGSSIEIITQRNSTLVALSPSRLSFFQQNKRYVNKEFPSCDVNDLLPFGNKCVSVRLKTKLLKQRDPNILRLNFFLSLNNLTVCLSGGVVSRLTG